jgi:hypothetical protein
MSSGNERVGLRLLIERLGGQVDPVRPHDGSCFLIHRNFGEVAGVIQRREDARPLFGREVDIPGRAVAEQQAEHVVTDHGHPRDDWQVVLAHTLMLCQRLDGEQLLIPPGPFPVGHDLVPPEPCPFPDELQGAGIEAASKHLSVHRDRGTPPGMVGVEVGYRVIALVPVHVDHDPVERADTRHGPTITDSSLQDGIADLEAKLRLAAVTESERLLR